MKHSAHFCIHFFIINVVHIKLFEVFLKVPLSGSPQLSVFRNTHLNKHLKSLRRLIWSSLPEFLVVISESSQHFVFYRARVDIHRKENMGMVEKAITIYGQPTNCSDACLQVCPLNWFSPFMFTFSFLWKKRGETCLSCFSVSSWSQKGRSRSVKGAFCVSISSPIGETDNIIVVR